MKETKLYVTTVSFISVCSTCKVVCTASDKGLNVEVKYFQLRRIRIPSDVEKQFIQALVLQEQNEEEKLKQDAVVVRKETSQKVWGIIQYQIV